MRNWVVWGVIVLVAATLLMFGANASEGDFVWAKGMGGANTDLSQSIAVDSAGNVYTTGRFLGTADFDPGLEIFNLTAANGNSIFVSKLDSSGDFVWAKVLDTNGFAVGYGIAVDSAGSVYITGYFSGTVDFDPGQETHVLHSVGAAAFVLKLDSAGNFVWVKSMGGGMDASASGFDIAVDGTGNVYTTGSFSGTVDFDPGFGAFNLTSAGANDVFVSKLDSTGAFVWAKAMGGLSDDYGIGIAVDGTGNVYAAGAFKENLDFGPGLDAFDLTSAGNTDVFVSKLDSAGDFVWANALGGTGDDYLLGIAVDSAGNVHATGSFSGTVDFDPGTAISNLTSEGASDAFVWKLDSAGKLVWAKAMGGQGMGVALDSAGSVYTLGSFLGTVDVDPGPNTFTLTSASPNLFVSKLNSDGIFVWANAQGGGTGEAHGTGIALDSTGDVYTAGYFAGTTDFDPGPGTFELTPAGSADIFVSKLSGPPPSAISITPTTTDPPTTDSIVFMVVFDRPVQGFDEAADVVVSLTGSAANTGVSIVGSGNTYSVTVTGLSGEGTLTLAVNTASDVRDLDGNPLATSVTSAAVALDPLATGLPLVAWPVGLALLAVGTAAMALRRAGRK